MKKRKSISHWWSILADNYGWLWKNNLLYLLCIAPSVICGFLFFSFHAYLFLALSLLFLISSGPAALAVQKVALDAALEEPGVIRMRFFGVYRKCLCRGMLLGLVLAVAMVLIGLPVYFALAINSPVLPLLAFACCLSLLLWYSCSAQLLAMLCACEKVNWTQLPRGIFEPGIMSVVFGFAKLLWVFLFFFAPAFTASLALLGAPAIIKFSILYYLYNQGDTNEQVDHGLESISYKY